MRKIDLLTSALNYKNYFGILETAIAAKICKICADVQKWNLSINILTLPCLAFLSNFGKNRAVVTVLNSNRTQFSRWT